MNLQRWVHLLGVCAAIVGGTAALVVLPGCSDSPPPKSDGDKKAETDKKNDRKESVSGKITSIDMLAVFVHKDNPIKSLTLEQVDAIFSKTRKAGAAKDAKTWGDLGLEGQWKDKPIDIYGRNSASGTYAFFKEHVLLNGDYK